MDTTPQRTDEETLVSDLDRIKRTGNTVPRMAVVISMQRQAWFTRRRENYNVIFHAIREMVQRAEGTIYSLANFDIVFIFRVDNPQQFESIVTELDELLKQARKQQSQQQQSSGSKKPQQSRRDKPGQPQQQPAGGKPEEAGNEPARDSTEQQRPEAPAQPDIGQMQDMLRELWGHLPEHERQQVINSTIEKFVPKYESLIKEYFKRLSEATRSQP